MRSPDAKVRRWTLEAAKIAIGIGLLAFLWRKGLIDPIRLGQALRDHPWWLLAAIALQGALFLMLAVRWKLVLAANRLPITTRSAARLTLLSHFFSTCLPGNGAGDLVKGWIFSRRGTDYGTVLGTMALDRIIGIASMFLVWSGYLVVAMAREPASRALLAPFAVVAMACGGGLLAVVAFSRRLDRFLSGFEAPANKWAARILESLKVFVSPIARGSASLATMAGALSISFAIQTSQSATAWVAGQILSIPVGMVAAGAVLPLVALANSIPLSPGGVGLGEAAGAAAMRQFGVPDDAGAQVVLVVRITSVFWALAGAFFYLALRPAEKEPSAPQR